MSLHISIKLWQIHCFVCSNLHICIKYEDWNNKYAHSAIWHHIFSFPFTNQKKAFLFFLPSWFHLYLKIYSVLFLFIYLFILSIYKGFSFFVPLDICCSTIRYEIARDSERRTEDIVKTKNQFFQAELKHIFLPERWYRLAQTEILKYGTR